MLSILQHIVLHTNAIDQCVHSCSYLDVERFSLGYNILQLNDNVYVHLMNLECEYVTLVLLGLEDDAISLFLGDQSQSLDIYACLAYIKYGQK